MVCCASLKTIFFSSSAQNGVVFWSFFILEQLTPDEALIHATGKELQTKLGRYITLAWSSKDDYIGKKLYVNKEVGNCDLQLELITEHHTSNVRTKSIVFPQNIPLGIFALTCLILI